MKVFEDYRQVGNLVYVSGQLPRNETGEVDNKLSIYHQVISELTGIEAIVRKFGSTKDNIVKTNVFMTDITAVSEINKAYNDFFTNLKPARSAFQVSKLVGEVSVEIDAVIELT